MVRTRPRRGGRSALLPWLALPIGLLMVAARPAQAQSTSEGLTSGSAPDPATVLDMESLDPHDFRAVAEPTSGMQRATRKRSKGTARRSSN